MPDGRWFSYLFRNFGAVGRIPYLVPVKWEDGWPVLGVDGKVPETLELPANKSGWQKLDANWNTVKNATPFHNSQDTVLPCSITPPKQWAVMPTLIIFI